jgi:acetyl-CoA carboxylase alpha subunit
MALRLKAFLDESLRELSQQPLPELLAGRYEKFRRMGQFLDREAEAAT